MKAGITTLASMQRVAAQALATLGPLADRSRVFVSGEIVPAGTILGPAFQGIVARRTGVLVFCDFHPGASFAHDCRYLLFDPDGREPPEQYDARFPPYNYGVPQLYREVLRTADTLELATLEFSPPNIAGNQPHKRQFPGERGTRRAVLFSGETDAQHLNTLEICWRVLLAHQFTEENIAVYNFDGHVNAVNWDPATRQKLSRLYKLQVRGKGSKEEFLKALAKVGQELQPDDLLFIFTTGHGEGDASGTYLVAFDQPPNFDKLFDRELEGALRQFNRHRGLIVLMQQCAAGGFATSIVDRAKAPVSFIAATTSDGTASGSDDKPPGIHQFFAWNWFAALNGEHLDGQPLKLQLPDPTRPTTVKEAFCYAERVAEIRDDEPQYQTSASMPGDSLQL